MGKLDSGESRTKGSNDMKQNWDYDIAVIGGGPAGYTAALYAGRGGYRAAVFEKGSPGGQMGITSEVENYPGFERVDGFTLAAKMMEQAEGFGAAHIFSEVTDVVLEGEKKRITTADGKTYTCGAVIVAVGAKPRLLGIPGEGEYTGHGVSYCATCDGMFYRKKTVVVVGGGDTAFEDALYLSNLCEQVILVHRREAFRASAVSVKRAKEKENIAFELNAVPEEILGDGQRVTGVRIRNTISGETKEIPCAGVFAAVGRTPETGLFQGKLERDQNGYIPADETCRTSVAGVFAAGDVRTKPLRQIVTACADGAVAVQSAEEWLLSVSETE